MTPCRSTDYTHLQSYPGNGGNAWNYGAAINAPFADHTAALRIMGFRRDSPGYVDDTRRGGKPDVNTLEQYGFRGALTWLPADRLTVGLLAKIGRASCRERVCQYVKISVVAVS